jgi:pimeloyl-ACP methyl ester carboxylesterase
MFPETQLGTASWNVAVGPENGPPLVLFHGVTRSWQTFLPILPALAARWQVFVVDFPGHGASSPLRGGRYHVVDYVREAADLLRETIRGRCVVYGHSLGAMVTAALAAELPGMVRAVVLEDPPFDTMGRRIAETPLHSYFAGMRMLAGSRAPLAELARQVADLRFVHPGTGRSTRAGEVRDAASLRLTAWCLSRLDPRVLDPIVAGEWLAGYERDAILEGIECPALVLQADERAGGMLIDEDAAALVGRLRDGTLVPFAGAGHLLHWQRTQELLNVVTAFVETSRQE